MVKMSVLFGAAAALAIAPVSVAGAAVLGPDSAKCGSGSGPAVLVKVSGLKSRVGKLRVRTFSGAKPSAWFNKKMALKRVEVDIPDGGPIEICMPVPSAGGYVVDLRHDLNNNGDTDKSDGAGASGNPTISMFDFFLGRKPPASKVVVQVGEGVVAISVVMKYIQGGSFKPAQVSAR